MHAGDFALGATIDIKFTTRRFSTGAPYTLAGTPVISAYPDNSTTQLTAGITLSVDFDGVTGMNNVRVVATSGNGYASGVSYDLVITTGTVDSVSVVGEVVGRFTLERSAAWAVANTRLPTALVSGRIDASVGAMAANVLTATAINAAALNGKGDWNVGKAGYELSTAGAKAIWDMLTSTITTTGSIGKYILDHIVGILLTGNHNPQTGDTYALANGSDGFANIHTDAGNAAAKTAYLPSITAGAAGGVFIAGANAATTVNFTGSISTVTNSVSVSVNNDKTGYSLSASGILEVWHQLVSGISTVGSIGKRLVDYITGDTYARIGTNGAGLTDLATAAELAKVPKSDGSVAWNATALDAIFDEQIGDSTVTFRQALRLVAAALGGKVSGAGTTTIIFRNVADDTNRVTATVDVDGNRSAVTLSL